MTFVHQGADRETGLPAGTVLGADFFRRPSNEVGRDLVGKILWSAACGGGRLTEVEAYLPEEDPASHSACGPTRRNAAMFGPPGTIYVFLSYGVHYLFNIVCDRPMAGAAVLIRAFERLEDGNRPPAGDRARKQGCFRGPGRVGKALGVHPGLNGLSLGEASGLFVVDDGARPGVEATTRIGISRGDLLPLRYYALGSTCVTKPSRTREGPCR